MDFDNMQNYLNVFESIGKLIFNINLVDLFSLMIKVIIVCGLILLAIFLVGFLIDNLKDGSYSVKNYLYRKEEKIGSREEYYYRYWVWQPCKKRYLVSVLQKDLGIDRIYSRKAIRKKKFKPTRIPFLREVYGNANKY